MTDRWFFAHDNVKHGPFTSQQLFALATAGKILRTDTVWKEGIERGVPAAQVKNLFPATSAHDAPVKAAATSATVAAATIEPLTEPAPPTSEETAEPAEPESSPQNEPVETLAQDGVTAEEAPAPPKPKQVIVRKNRAIAGKGTRIVSQDGLNVRIKKKCTVCGREDNNWSTLRIKPGLNRATFFCRTCKRIRDVEFQGVSG